MIGYRHYLPPLLLFLFGLGLYAFTLAPTVTGTDAGELILAAYSGGVAHAPGFPTWLLVAWPVSHLPFADPARLLNVLSALAAALTLPVLWAWLVKLPVPSFSNQAVRSVRTKRKESSESKSGIVKMVPWLAFIAVLSFSVGRSFWPWATTTEVYTLNTLLIAITLYMLFRWSREDGENRKKGTALILAAFTYGLALGAHLATTALLAPAIALWLYWHRDHLSLRLLLFGTLAFLLALGVYAWLPLRASTDPVFNWGDPDTPYRFWRHISAAQYRNNINLNPASIARELRFGLTLTFWQFGPLGSAVIAWGLWWGWRRQRRLTQFVLVSSIVSALYAVLYAIEDDQDAYYSVIHMLLLVPLLWGLWLATRATIRRFGYEIWRWVLAGAFVVPLLAFFVNLPGANRSDYWYHEDYYRNLTGEVATDATIFTRDWQFYSPSLYFQHVLGDRPDLRVIDVELMRRDWYLNHLQQWYPELTDPAAEELTTYRALRDAWERDPKTFEQDLSRVQALQNAFIDTVNALIAAADALGDVHLSHDHEQGVGARFSWTPIGLTFRLDPLETPPAPPPELTWDLQHLAGQWHRLPDDPARKVASVHTLMLQNRALYLARLGDMPGALAALELAGQLNPSDALTEQLRKEIQGFR